MTSPSNSRLRPFASLTHGSQMRRLRRLAAEALARYALPGALLRPLKSENNTTFRATTAHGERFVLRIARPGRYGLPELRSEFLWLAALRQEAGLLVPEPVPAADGALAITVSAPGIPEPRHCLLFRWIPGRIPSRGVQPAELERLGECTARLHLHSERWTPPAGFVRPHWDWERFFGPSSALAAGRGVGWLGQREQEVLAAAAARMRAELAALGRGPGVYGLIHSDLCRENYLFQDGRAAIIDFDDCGWGYYLFDVATTLSAVQRSVGGGERYQALQEAYLAGYRRLRPLPARLCELLPTFLAMREMEVLDFILGSDNARFWAWAPGRVAQALDNLEAYLQAQRP